MDPAPAIAGGGFGPSVAPPPNWPTARPAPDMVSRFTYLTGGFAAACLVIFLLQAFPYTGIILMFLLAPLWIGLLVHAYFITLAVLGLNGYLPRPVIALPIMFYVSGAAMGLYGDLMAARWKGTQTWVEINATVPDSTRHITFDPWNVLDGYKLKDPNGVFRPEALGFDLAVLKLRERQSTRSDDLLVLQPEIGAGQRCGERGVRMMRIAGRCYLHQSMSRPRIFLQLGGRDDLTQSTLDRRRPREKPPEFDWGKVSTFELPVWLVEDGAYSRVATLRGASITKNHYFLWPTAGCLIGGGGNGWGCFWHVTVPFRHEGAGFYPGGFGLSPDTPDLLMQTLKALRGQKT